MLSTLSNLLPSLSSQNTAETPRAPASPQPPQLSERKDEGEHRRERARPQNETFIVVRPPPAMSNHPLNLQLQLIPPAVVATHGKDRSGSLSNAPARRSMDFTGASPDVVPDGDGDRDRESVLRRSPSVTSDGTSLYSSASSSGSMSSLASSGSSRRIIVPLYNLSAHNVMTNAVLDAGTDAKIAKFLKRGLELIDLCVLEPTEHWHGPHLDGVSITLSERVGSPVPSADSLEPPAAVETTPTPAKRSRFNIFTRKDAGRSQSALALTPTAAAPSPTKSRAATSPARAPEQLSVPVLGMQAAVASPVFPPVGKSPASIAWVVRKWIKGSDSSLLANLRISTPNRKDKDKDVQGVPTVRFEWVRAPRSGTADSHSRWPTDLTAAGHVQQGSRRSSRITSTATDDAHPHPHARASSSAAAGVSLPASPKSSEFGLPGDASSHHSTTDAGDESDPEDSETPWTCTLVISASGTVSPAYSRDRSPDSRRASTISSDQHLHPHKSAGGSFRLRLATLAPTPHHPKVVAQLKIPWPLPDVDVVQGIAHKRGPSGRPFEPSPGSSSGLIVTAEEMKDVVCTTAFWMIIREGFGGVGKRTRKGDGWNIRG